MRRTCSGVRKAWAACLALVLSLAACCGGQDSAEEFAKQFRKRVLTEEPLKFDTVRPYRDRFCYYLKTKQGDISVARKGTCLRAAIFPRGKMKPTAYVFADESGIYVSKNETSNYTLVMQSGNNEGDVEGFGIAELYMWDQLGALKRTYVCDDEVPKKIFLPNRRVAKPRARAFDACARSCLTVYMLQNVPHVRLGRAHESRVLCFGKLCMTPMHRVFLRGRWLTMANFCSENGGCRESVEHVVKALFGTQAMREGDFLIRYGVVYGRGVLELAATRFLQAVVDVAVSVQRRARHLLSTLNRAGEPAGAILEEKPHWVCEPEIRKRRVASLGTKDGHVCR